MRNGMTVGENPNFGGNLILYLFRATILHMENLTSTVVRRFLFVNLCSDMFRP